MEEGSMEGGEEKGKEMLVCERLTRRGGRVSSLAGGRGMDYEGKEAWLEEKLTWEEKSVITVMQGIER